MKDIEVYDNFLSLEDHKKIVNEMAETGNFPWYTQALVADDSFDGNVNDNLEFIHMFYRDYSISSNYFHLIQPIVSMINPIALIRIRAAFSMRREYNKANAYHIDYENCTTAIYYVNTNNGQTIFQNDKKIDSVANRLVVFDSNLIHTGTFCTDSRYRCLINFNYFE